MTEPIPIKLIDSQSIPWDSIIPAATAIIVAWVSGYLAFRWQGRNIKIQIEEQQKSNRVDRKIRVAEQTLIPVRKAVSKLTSELADYSAWANDPPARGRSERDKQFHDELVEFSVIANQITDSELEEMVDQFVIKLRQITEPYLGSTRSKQTGTEFYERTVTAQPELASMRTKINRKIERLLQ